MEVLFMKLKNIFKIFTCKHPVEDLVFIRNIYGDEINQLNARSIWLCPHCNRLIYKQHLFDIGDYSAIE